MELNDVSETKIEPGNGSQKVGCKFIVAGICIPGTLQVMNVFRANNRVGYHYQIFGALELELQGTEMRAVCRGGGRLDLDPERKTIFLSGESQEYGKEVRALTIELLKRNFPEYSVTGR